MPGRARSGRRRGRRGRRRAGRRVPGAGAGGGAAARAGDPRRGGERRPGSAARGRRGCSGATALLPRPSPPSPPPLIHVLGAAASSRPPARPGAGAAPRGPGRSQPNLAAAIPAPGLRGTRTPGPPARARTPASAARAPDRGSDGAPGWAPRPRPSFPQMRNTLQDLFKPRTPGPSPESLARKKPPPRLNFCPDSDGESQHLPLGTEHPDAPTHTASLSLQRSRRGHAVVTQ